MKDIGGTIKQMFQEGLFMLTAMFMKVNGLMTKLMDMALITMLMELCMWDIGKRICNMEKV